MAYSEAIAARIRKVLEGRTGIVEKKMFGGIAFLLGRKMLIGVLGEKIVARCRPEDQPRLLKSPHVKPMDFTGRPMKGWLFVTGPVTSSPTMLRKWIASSEAAIVKASRSSR